MKKPATPATPAGNSPAALNRFLYVTAAIAGGVLMVVEILGAKMLAPYFGTSHFVWVAQIGVTMAALACGYFLGGKLADRSPNPGALFTAYLVAAAWCAASVLAVEAVSYACLKYSLALGSILASVVLYFVPLTCMAMTVPFLIRAVSQSLSNLGSRVGTLSAVSTVGSFLGTAGIGYVLIPLVANSTTMFGCAAVLALLAAAYYLAFARKAGAVVKPAIIAAWILLAAFLAGRQEKARLGGAVELFRGNSHYGMLQVVQVGLNSRYYLNDFLAQNIYDPESGQSTAMFTYMLAELSRSYAASVDSALCIGMGVGIVPMDLARAGTRVDVVEINPAVVPVAEEFFDFDRTKLNLFIDDGRHFLNATTNRYDAVILDAFLGDSSPAHLMSREAFGAMRRCLNPGGVLVINCFGELDARRNYFTASLDKTLRSVFKSVKIHAQGNGNLFFVASDQSELRRLREPDFQKINPQARSWVEGAFRRELTMNPADGIVLTDDYNPVDYYDAANREELRKGLAFSMRKP